MSTATRSHLAVAAVVAAMLIGVPAVAYGLTWVVGGPVARPEPEPQPASTGDVPQWLDDMLYGGDQP